MKKKVIYNEEAREGLLRGINTLADAVKTTLGGRGQNVLIEEELTSTPIVTKDGVTVAKSIELDDPVESLGVELMKQVATLTNNEVGDGTSSSTVLAQAILNKSMALLKDNINPIFLKNGIEIATKQILSKLDEMALPVDDDIQLLTQIASVSANNDEELGKLIGQGYYNIGKYGKVQVERSHTSDSYIENSNGISLKEGVVAHYLIERQKPTNTLYGAKILVTDHPINNLASFNKADGSSIIQELLNEGEKVVIICSTADQVVTHTAFQHNIFSERNNKSKLIFVKAPEYGELQENLLEDVAVVTGGSFISKDRGITLSSITRDDFGECSQIVLSVEDTIIIGGQGVTEVKENHIQSLTERLVDANKDQKLQITERLARLTEGVSMLYVGARAEVELRERIDRAVDAVNATKSAIDGGVVPGGGIALLNVKLDIPDNLMDDEKVGFKIMSDILSTPFYHIIDNAGENVEDILYKIASQDNPNFGFDVKHRNFGDMFDLGVIDPVKVTKSALQNAVTVAGTLLTTQCVIINSNSTPKESPNIF